MNPVMEKLALTPESVDQAAELTEQFCTEIGLDRKNTIRYRLSVENVILRWYEHNVSDSFRISMGKRFRKYYISLECTGLPVDPFAGEEETDGSFVHDFRQNLGVFPQYSYKNGKNRSLMQFKTKEVNNLIKILIALGLAFVLGILMKLLFPPTVSTELLNGFVNPLFTAIFRLLGFVAGPLILLSVMWGIYGIGDATTLGLLGKDLILRYLLVSFFLTCCCILTFPVFHLNFTQAAGGGSAFQSIFEMLLDIIPANIISPLVSNNTLQIIFCAVIIGIAMLFLGKDVHTVADFIEQVNAIVRFLMEFISKLIPVVVFLIVLRMILSDTLILFASAWRLVLIFIVEALLFCTILTVVTAVKQKVSPILLLKKSIPTMIISITTASSAAAFGSNTETCEKHFGINKSLSSFGIPLGMVIYKTACSIYYVLICLYFARMFSVPVSANWLISAGFISFMMSFSAPPVPGGGVIVYTLLFDRLGIPGDALSIVIAIDVVFDFLLTTVNMYALPLTLLNSAAVQGLLDREILCSQERKPKKAAK